MIALIIVALATVFIGLVVSLVVLKIGEEKALGGFNESGCVELFGEEGISYDKRLENYIMEERSKNNETGRLSIKDDYEPVVGTLSNSMFSKFSVERRHEDLVLSLN